MRTVETAIVNVTNSKTTNAIYVASKGVVYDDTMRHTYPAIYASACIATYDAVKNGIDRDVGVIHE